MEQPRYDREVVHTHVWVHQDTFFHIDKPALWSVVEVCSLCWKHRIFDQDGKIVR